MGELVREYGLIPDVVLSSDAVRARLTAGEERERIWARALAIYPGWAQYRSRVPHRDIGVFVLSADQR